MSASPPAAPKFRFRRASLDTAELHVSAYERASSLLFALLLFAASSAGLLLLVWLSSKVLRRDPPIPVIVEDIRGAGGIPEGFAGESMNLEGPLTGDVGSDPALIVPQLQKTMDVMADALSSSQADLSNPSLSDEIVTGGVGGSRGDGRRPGLGVGGGGDGAGVPRQQRWEIIFPPGRSSAEYGAYLDQFGIELGVIGSGPEIEYASHFSGGGKPQVRRGRREDEKRLYMSWSQGDIRSADVTLLKKAGINTEGRLVVQFFPPETENLLAFKELDFAKREAIRIRRTRFAVLFRDDKYEFKVDLQTPL